MAPFGVPSGGKRCHAAGPAQGQMVVRKFTLLALAHLNLARILHTDCFIEPEMPLTCTYFSRADRI